MTCRSLHIQHCNGLPLYCSWPPFRMRRCRDIHSDRLRLRRALSRRNATPRRKRSGGSGYGGQKRIQGDPVVREFESLVMSRESSNRQAWEKCKRFALSQMSSCTPHRANQIIYWCKKGWIFDEELLNSVLRVGLDDEEYMLGFRGDSVGATIQGLGMLARKARRERMWKGRWMEELMKEFAVKLVVTHMKRNGFEEHGFNARWLSSTLHGLGLLVVRKRNERISPQVLEVSKALVAAFVKACQRRDPLPMDIANALHGCANLGLKKENDFLSDDDLCVLVEYVLNARRGVKGRDLSMMVWSMGKMGLDCAAALDILSAEIMRDEQLVELNARYLSNIVYGFGLLDYFNSDALDRIATEISKGNKLRSYNPQDLSNFVYAFGLLKYHNSDALEKLSSEIGRADRLRYFTKQALSIVVYGFGLLNYVNLDVLDKLAAEISRRERLRSFSEQHIANIVYGFGLLKYCNVKMLNRISNELSRGDLLVSFKDQGLANLVYGFGLLNYYNSDALDGVAAEMMKKRRLRSFTVQALSNIVYGFGLLKYCNSGFLDEISREIVKEKRLRSFDEQNLSNIVYGFGLLGYLNADALEKICGEISREDRLRSMTGQELSNVAKGLSDVGYVDTRLLDLLLEGYLRIADQDGDAVVDIELGMMMIACAVVNHHNGKFWEFTKDYISRKIGSFSSLQPLCNILWACAVLEILESDIFLRVCKHIELLGLSGTDLGVSELRQIVQAWLYFKMVKKRNLDLPDHTRALMEKAMEVCRSDDGVTTSAFEKQMLQELTDMGVDCDTDAPIGHGLIRVDILVSERDPKVVIECDGPHHYSSNKPDGSFMVLGSTLLRNRILEAHGYKVVCIPYFATKDKKRQLLKSAVMHSS